VGKVRGAAAAAQRGGRERGESQKEVVKTNVLRLVANGRRRENPKNESKKERSRKAAISVEGGHWGG